MVDDTGHTAFPAGHDRPDRDVWQAPSFDPGHVWLVGAGPGDPGLMTRWADHALSHADVIFYDALIHPAILARAAARRVFVGKRGGKCSPSQETIHRMLIEAARAGHRVLRLKGGDPFVFSRGGEEVLALGQAGIPFRVIPGVSSGTGALTAAGIPLTHRGINSCAAFVTGHDSHGELPRDIDWPSLCRGVPVLVFFMALRRLKELARALVDNGRRKNEDVAIISHASTPQQKIHVTTLGACLDGAIPELSPPALIVVGPVVGLRASIVKDDKEM